MDLETTNLRRDWWLVKVPNYMGQAFAQKECGANLGKLKVSRTARGQEVTFDVDPSFTLDGKVQSDDDLPREHKMSLHPAPKYAMSILSETYPSPDESVDGKAPDSKKPGTVVKPEHVSVEGRVVQKADVRPASTAAYMAQKRKQVVLAQTPKNPVKTISRHVTFKPVSRHKEDEEQKKRSKEEGKRVRQSKEEVEEMLFRRFELHQYYTFADLLRLTEQPPTYLKEILKGIAVYNTKGAHKNMWELKAELRRYDDDDNQQPATSTS